VIADAFMSAIIDKDNEKAVELVDSITKKYPIYR